MLGEHKNVVHFLRTERSTDTNNYWHPKNNIRVLNHWNQWPKENELTSSIASSVMTQKMFLRHTANNFNNQHPQKKTLTHSFMNNFSFALYDFFCSLISVETSSPFFFIRCYNIYMVLRLTKIQSLWYII